MGRFGKSRPQFPLRNFLLDYKSAVFIWELNKADMYVVLYWLERQYLDAVYYTATHLNNASRCKVKLLVLNSFI